MSARLIVAVCHRCDYSFGSTDATAVALWRAEHDEECPAPVPNTAREYAA